MKLVLLVWLGLTISIWGKAQEWKRVQLTDSCSVEFPKSPQISDLNSVPFWESENEGNGKCLAMITDFGKMDIDAQTLQASMERPAALDELKDGLLRDFKGSKLLSESRGNINGHLLFDIYIDTGVSDPGNYDRMHYRAIVAGDKLYSLYFYEDSKKPNPAMRDRFLQSLKLKE